MTALRKTLVALAGGSLLLAGLAMLVLPGPAFVVIPAALAILAIEFAWARRWLAWLRERFKALAGRKPGRSPAAACEAPRKPLRQKLRDCSKVRLFLPGLFVVNCRH
jgi:uncharacterized protein (TIGR02611 family)